MSSTVYVMRKAARKKKPTHDVIAPTFGEPSTDVYRNIASIGNRIVEGYTALVKPLEGTALHAALQRGDVDAIVAGLDWPALVTNANALLKPLQHTLSSFARLEVDPKARPIRKAQAGVAPKSVSTMVPLDQKALPKLFTTIDTAAVHHAQTMAGKLIVSITEDTREQVRTHVATALKGDLTVQQLARRLRDVVPLTPAQSASVSKLYTTHYDNAKEAWSKAHPTDYPSLQETTSWHEAAAGVTSKAAATKLRARAANIARTEVVAASNQGRYLAWQATVDSGLAASNSRKEWIAAAGACPDCAALDGEQVAWDEPFSTGDDMPPDHPSCRCSAVMIPPDAAKEPVDPEYGNAYVPAEDAAAGPGTQAELADALPSDLAPAAQHFDAPPVALPEVADAAEAVEVGDIDNPASPFASIGQAFSHHEQILELDGEDALDPYIVHEYKQKLAASLTAKTVPKATVNSLLHDVDGLNIDGAYKGSYAPEKSPYQPMPGASTPAPAPPAPPLVTATVHDVANTAQEAAAATPAAPQPKAAWKGSPVGGKTGQAIQDLQGKLYQGTASTADVNAAKFAVNTAMGLPKAKKLIALDHIADLVEHHGGQAKVLANDGAAAQAAAQAAKEAKAAAELAAAETKAAAAAQAAAEAKKLAAVNDAVNGYTAHLDGDGVSLTEWNTAHGKLVDAGMTADAASAQLAAADGGLSVGQLASASVHDVKLKPGASAAPTLGAGDVTGKAAAAITDLEQKLVTGHAGLEDVAEAKAAIGKIPGLSGTKKLAAQARLDDVVKHHGLDAGVITPKPPSSKTLADWKDKPAPVKPIAPEPPATVGPSAFNEWLAETKKRYADFAAKTGNPKTNLEQSLNWNNVKQVIEHHDMGALASLKQNSYIDQAGYDKAVAAMKAASKPLPGAGEKYTALLQQYEMDLAQHDLDVPLWREVNGITVKLSGMDEARMFKDNYEGVAWANQNLPVPTGSGLTAIKKYTGSSYSPWNGALRSQAKGNKPITGTWADDTRKADAGFVPLKEPIMAYRGTGWDEFEVGGQRLRNLPPPPPTDLIGSVHIQQGYMSTSVGTSAAFGGQVQMRIMTPAGHPTAWIAPKSNFVNEREMLMSRGSKYFVHDVYKEGNQWIVEVEILPPGLEPSDLVGHPPMPGTKTKPAKKR